MADLMDMRWLVRDINQRAVDEVRIQHIFTPGLPDEIRRERIRRRKFAQAESHIPFYFLLDIAYIWSSFLSVVVALIYFLMFLTLLGWKPSIDSFVVPLHADAIALMNAPPPTSSYDAPPLVPPTETTPTPLPRNEHLYEKLMLEEKGYNTHNWAAYYLVLGVILCGISWYSYFGAGIVGRRYIYIVSLFTHFVVLFGEGYAVLSAFSKLPKACNTTEFREHMMSYFIWYGILSPHILNHGHEAMVKMDAVQGALACCGVDGYKDYEHIFATIGDPAFNDSWYPTEIFQMEGYGTFDIEYYKEKGREIRQVPPSCCTPFWRPNVYCAEDLFTMERELPNNTIAKDRINPLGCVEAVGQTCDRMVYLLTYGMLTILYFRVFLWLFKLVLTGVILRSMHLIMTTLFSVTRGNARFVYDYRRTRPEEDPYKKAIGDFRRGVVPEGWEEFVENRIEGRKKALPISEQFTVGQLADNAALEDRLYMHLIQKWKGEKARAEGKEIYFGVGVGEALDKREAEFLEERGHGNKEFRTADTALSRLATIGNRMHRPDKTFRRPLKLAKMSPEKREIERLRQSATAEQLKKEQEGSFADDGQPIVPIPEDASASPLDVSQEPESEEPEQGKWKEKFKKGVHSVMEILAEKKARENKIQRMLKKQERKAEKRGRAKDKEKAKDKERAKDKEKAKDKERAKDKEKAKDKDKSKDKDKPKEKDKHKKRPAHRTVSGPVQLPAPIKLPKKLPKLLELPSIPSIPSLPALPEEPKLLRGEERKRGKDEERKERKERKQTKPEKEKVSVDDAKKKVDEKQEKADEKQRKVDEKRKKGDEQVSKSAEDVRPKEKITRKRRDKTEPAPKEAEPSKPPTPKPEEAQQKSEVVEPKVEKEKKKQKTEAIPKPVVPKPEREPSPEVPTTEILPPKRKRRRREAAEGAARDTTSATTRPREKKSRRKRTTRPASPPTRTTVSLPIIRSKARQERIKRIKPVPIEKRKPWNYGALGSSHPSRYVM